MSIVGNNDLRESFLKLHRELIESSKNLNSVECDDESYKMLLISIDELVLRIADLVAESTAIFLPVPDALPKNYTC